MTAKEFLSLYKANMEKIRQNRSRMISAERRAWEICSRNYFEYTSEFEDKLWEENEELAREMVDVERAIEQLSDGNCKQVLCKRYISGKKWSEIAEEMCYSEQHIHRLHQKALNQLILPLRYRNS